MSKTDPKNSSAGESSVEVDSTKLINPATDTLKIDLELAKASEAVLIVIRGTPQGKKYPLSGVEFYIGRDKDTNIQINDANVSRKHAKITKNAEKYFIEDCGSRNGTYVNDEKITSAKCQLSKEDMIKIGSTVLKYLPAGTLETLYHANLTNAAYIDKLTNVYNRNYINEVFEVEYKRAKALHASFSIILFDIDNFKKVNDTHGHDAGDFVLKQLASKVKEAGLRERDILGRYGGEEFLIVLGNTNIDQAKEVAERVRKSIAEHEFNYNGTKIPVTVSLGVALLKKEYADHTALYKAADEALYKSKHNGKNQVTTN